MEISQNFVAFSEYMNFIDHLPTPCSQRNSSNEIRENYLHNVDISSTTYLPRLFNIVCEWIPKLTSLVLLPIVRPTQFVTQCRNECLWYFKPVISWRTNILPKECTYAGRNECLWYCKPVISWRHNILTKECTYLWFFFLLVMIRLLRLLGAI